MDSENVYSQVFKKKTATICFPKKIMLNSIRDGPFDIQGGGGGWDFFEKNSSFPIRNEKIKCLQRS